MTNYFWRYSYLFFLLGAAVSCQTPEEKCIISPDIKIELNFSSLEDSIPAIRTKRQLVNFFSKHVALRDVFFGRKNYPNDSVFINQLFKRFVHPSFDTLSMETKKVFGNGQSLRDEFRTAFANIKH